MAHDAPQSSFECARSKSEEEENGDYTEGPSPCDGDVRVQGSKNVHGRSRHNLVSYYLSLLDLFANVGRAKRRIVPKIIPHVIS